MKKIITSIAAVAAIMSFANAGGKIVEPIPEGATVIPVVQESNYLAPAYIGVGAIASMTTRDACACDKDRSDQDDTRYGVILRAGYDFNDYLGIEARFLKTLGSNTFSKTTHYGIYLKPQYYINEKVNIYLLLGYGKTKLEFTNGISSQKITKNGFSYGIGVEYTLKKKMVDGTPRKSAGIWIDYQRLLKGKGTIHAGASIVSAGISYDF
jgi:opacity protein-like surface antigen